MSSCWCWAPQTFLAVRLCAVSSPSRSDHRSPRPLRRRTALTLQIALPPRSFDFCSESSLKTRPITLGSGLRSKLRFRRSAVSGNVSLSTPAAIPRTCCVSRRTLTVAAFDTVGYLATGSEVALQYLPSPLYSTSAVSDFAVVGRQQFTPAADPVGDGNPRPTKQRSWTSVPAKIKQKEKVTCMPPPEGVESMAAAAAKPKRVRTGCLTCRERHLKCDEGLPNCQNCRKSSRVCKRGVRLNFIDTTVKNPPTLLPQTTGWAGKIPRPLVLVAYPLTPLE